ncbi:hypothetical protein NKG05_16975 [Oerskovia sp. M15]
MYRPVHERRTKQHPRTGSRRGDRAVHPEGLRADDRRGHRRRRPDQPSHVLPPLPLQEDVVFADHELLLDAVVVLLGETRPAARGHTRGARERRPVRRGVQGGATRVRPPRGPARDLRSTAPPPAGRSRAARPRARDHAPLRARVHVLPARLPAGGHRSSTASVAFAASVVAVHNAILRRWLRDPDQDLRPELEEAFADLRRAARHPSGADTEPTSSPCPLRVRRVRARRALAASS